jgi:hypothetical protein
MSDDEMVFDQDLNRMRPRHRGRIRSAGTPAPSKERPTGDVVEVWEGGRFIGYERTRKDVRSCYLPFHFLSFP